MSLWAVLVTGLLAGGASCAVVQGGLLAGTVARRAPAAAQAGSAQKKQEGQPAPPPPRIDDLAPAGVFLAAKLVSHAAFGAALGLLGDAVQLAPRTRGLLQIFTGIVMVVLALELLGLRGVRGVVPPPPAAWSRFVRRSGRWGGALAPAALGAATILIPCGVTLTMMFLAVASGSALAGAAIMATFVVGTMPTFAAIGYAARRSATALRGRLGILAGAAVLVAGLLAINAGLVLNGSSFTLAGVWQDLSGSSKSAPRAVAPPLPADGIQRLTISVHDSGYSPSSVAARANVPTTLIVRTDDTRGCTRSFVMSAFGVQRLLPATGDTSFDLGELRPGTYRYACGMGMYTGTIRVVA